MSERVSEQGARRELDRGAVAPQAPRPTRATREGPANTATRDDLATPDDVLAPAPLPAPDLDLDAEPGPPPSRGPRPLWPLLMMIGVLCLLGGAWLRSVLVSPPSSARPQLSAQATVRDFAPGPPPVATLEVVIASHVSDDRPVSTVTVSGGGLAVQNLDATGVVPGQQFLSLRLPVPLSCPASGLPAALAVRVTLLDGTVLHAVPSGAASTPGGICRAAQAALPGGGRRQAATESVRLEGQTFRLEVRGLPTDAAQIAGVQADGWLIPLVSGAASVQAGRASLVLLPPAPSCRDPGTRGLLPVGLVLILTGQRGGLQQVYLPVGPQLAAWLADARDRACPSGDGVP